MSEDGVATTSTSRDGSGTVMVLYGLIALLLLAGGVWEILRLL